MISHFENLLIKTANDGASACVGNAPSRDNSDLDHLLDAWYRERQDRLETGLFLDEARRLLKQIMAEGVVTSANRRKATRLLLAIQAAGQTKDRD